MMIKTNKMKTIGVYETRWERKRNAPAGIIQSCREMKRWAGEPTTTLYRHAVKMKKEVGGRETARIRMSQFRLA